MQEQEKFVKVKITPEIEEKAKLVNKTPEEFILESVKDSVDNVEGLLERWGPEDSSLYKK